VPNYEASTWQGLGAPKSTPIQMVDKLNQEINAGLADPTLAGYGPFSERCAADLARVDRYGRRRRAASILKSAIGSVVTRIK
jgi:hypothetical protein